MNYQKWLAALAGFARSPCIVIPPPPPIESETHIRKYPGAFAEKLKTHQIYPPWIRLAAWLRQIEISREFARQLNIEFVDLPPAAFSERGFLNEQYIGNDPTHGNTAYGELILRHILELAARPDVSGAQPSLRQGGSVSAQPSEQAGSGKRRHPYASLPDRAFWKQAVADVSYDVLDPVGDVPFKILKSDRVATAGSCFAQHISRRIRQSGFRFFTTENAPLEPAGHGGNQGYYDFSARYGNVYTARQLLQLFQRAFDRFEPKDDCWTFPGNKFCDPFRPKINPEGYSSREALVNDRRIHLSAVKQLFEQLDVFVFTLGLTECWVSKLDGAVYPLAPGVVGGEFDSTRHEFRNFGVDEVVSDLNAFVQGLRQVNPNARLILTVSPIPLKATYAPEHVLVSTSYSKAVLRVAAEVVSRSFEQVYYFPSYEIITGQFNRGRYFDADLRSVTREGVEHVLSVFMRHLAAGADSPEPLVKSSATKDAFMDEIQALAEADCDEEMLGR